MTFEEFNRKNAKYNAYPGWHTVSLAKASGQIPQQYHTVFKDNCECGSENIISSTLSREMCCDPQCPIKNGYRLAEMFTRYGIKGLGYATCKDVYDTLKKYDKDLKERGEDGLFLYNSYTEVLLVPWVKYPISLKMTAKGSDFFHACVEIRNRKTTFTQMVGKLGLKSLGSNSDKIFDCADSFTEWKEIVLSEGGISRFCMRRGISSTEVIFGIASAMESIAIADYACSGSLRKAGLSTLDICMTGRLQVDGKRYTKAEFVNLCTDLCKDLQGVQLLEIRSVTGAATVPFVIYSYVSGDNKFVRGRSRGRIIDDFGEHSVLISATDFYHWLKGAMLEWNKNLNLQKKENFYQILQRCMKNLTLSTTL